MSYTVNPWEAPIHSLEPLKLAVRIERESTFKITTLTFFSPVELSWIGYNVGRREYSLPVLHSPVGGIVHFEGEASPWEGALQRMKA